MLKIASTALCFNLLLATTLAWALPTSDYQITTVATNLKSPWSVKQLPNLLEDSQAKDIWLVTEKSGHVVIVDNTNTTSPQKRVKLALPDLYVAGQGGLLDLIPSPTFRQTGEVILSYSQGSAKANRLAIAKSIFDGQQFSPPQVIFTVKPDKDTPVHFAGRLLLLPDNTLLFSSGDGFDYREQAQVVDNHLGKLLRIQLDGSSPADGPFVDSDDAAAHAVYTLGHRNPQGLVYNSDSGQIISHEHGPAGGDELNIIRAGKNYGWPAVTLGQDYSGARISPFTDYPGMQQPAINWTPSIAPSGMVYYASGYQAFPSLQHHVLITTLVDRMLYAIDTRKLQKIPYPVFSNIGGRLRDITVTSNGEVAVLTDGEDAQLLLLRPKR